MDRTNEIVALTCIFSHDRHHASSRLRKRLRLQGQTGLAVGQGVVTVVEPPELQSEIVELTSGKAFTQPINGVERVDLPALRVVE